MGSSNINLHGGRIITIKNLLRKKEITIQQITKSQKEYGIKNRIIRKKYTTTTHKKYYVEDSIAARIWTKLNTNPEKVVKIKRDEIERQRMANESY